MVTPGCTAWRNSLSTSQTIRPRGASCPARPMTCKQSFNRSLPRWPPPDGPVRNFVRLGHAVHIHQQALAPVVVDQRARVCFRTPRSRSAITASGSSARWMNSPPSTSQRPSTFGGCRKYCKSRRTPCRSFARSTAHQRLSATDEVDHQGRLHNHFASTIHPGISPEAGSAENRPTQNRENNQAGNALIHHLQNHRVSGQDCHVPSSGLAITRAPYPRDMSRSMSPVERWGIAYSWPAPWPAFPFPSPEAQEK